ncbi:MAG: SusC/RagA family TonB-linked outer membrane protein, partial [Pedobacter sp.]
MKKLLQSLFILLFVAGSAWAQDRTITGTVTDNEDGSPLPGVTVRIVGATGGTQTGANGQYSLVVPSGSTQLQFSYLGYLAQTVSLTSSNVLNVSMATDAQLLGEVVVTGLGISREKKALGYAVQTLSNEDLTNAGNGSFVGALQGKLSGVDIKPSSGMPGASAQVTIRGARSFTGNNAPLYVVDGMPISSNADFSTGDGVTFSDVSNRSVDIDPNDIESMTVLKGQAASALYGVRASNGVIVITTKRGRGIAKGAPVVSFSSNFSVDQISRQADLQNVYAQGGFGAFTHNSSMSWGPKVEDLPNDPRYGGNTTNTYTTASGQQPGKYYVPQLFQAGLDPWATPTKYDNKKEFFDLGKTYNNSVNVSQATEKGNYSIGLGNSSQTGIISGTGLERYTAKLAGETNLSEAWKTGFSGNYAQSDIRKTSGANDGILGTVYSAPINYNLKGIPNHLPSDPYTQINYRSLTFNNPYWAAENNEFKERTNRFFGNGYLQYTPQINWGTESTMNVKYQLGVDSYATDFSDVFEFGSKGGTGTIDNYGVINSTYNSLLTVNYGVKLAEDLNLTALLGNEINHQNIREYSASGQNFNFGGFKHIDNTKIKTPTESTYQYRTVGFFANLDLAYRDMLFLTVTGRNDVVSNMPTANRSFFYPSASLGFVVTELGDLKDNNILSFLKLRASYAQVGQPGNYLNNFYALPAYGGGFYQDPPITYPIGGVTAYIPNSRMYDPNLSNQNTKSKEFGVDARFLNGLVNLDYTFSRQDVEGQIFPVPLAGSTG